MFPLLPLPLGGFRRERLRAQGRNDSVLLTDGYAACQRYAEKIGIIQSLIVTCRLHGVDLHTYLVDVLQRVSMHPASRVAELTPRLWKQYFADKPLRSDLNGLTA